MAIMYSADEDNLQKGLLCLEHTLGLNTSYTAAPDKLELLSKGEDAALAPLLLRAHESTAEFIVLNTAKDDLHRSVLENVGWSGHGKKSRHLVVIPLRTRNQTKGYVVLGLNPRLDFDEDHEQFVRELARQLRELMTRVTTEEETQRRELYLMTELGDIERRASRLASVVSTGIYEFGVDGSLRWANNQFYNILGVPQEYRTSELFNWMDYILPEDHERASERLMTSLTEAVEISDSLRLKEHYKPPQLGQDSQPIELSSWVMYNTAPDLKKNGSVGGLLGSLTDILHIKWSEQQRIRNAENARRDKHRQDEFIDITYHQMCNPLSAITQCADGVVFSLQEAKSASDAQALLEIVKLNVEAAESILLCAAHQGRIIDDVLTLGKLDSALLTIYPSVFRPTDLLEEAMRMFKTEFTGDMMNVLKMVDKPLAVSGESFVLGDPSRLMQILVNLLTNAIKFTKTQQSRHITLRYGSSCSVPSTELFGSGFKWYSTGNFRSDLTQEAEYGQGEVVYIYYVVVDSGKGIPSEVLGKLFSKFEQADRRTHTQNAGSGLGLYISRELTELQGGRIGIKSSDGNGSTFAFYTEFRRTEVLATKSEAPHAVKPILVVPSRKIGGVTPATILLAAVPNYNILLVEDNLLNQKVLKRQLEKAGCNVRVSNNGGEAIDSMLHMYGQLAEYDNPPSEDAMPYFDCILIDWEMPVCDGLKATKRIRTLEMQQSEAHNIIIGVTANARDEQIAMALDSGMDTVLSKPFRVAALIRKIGELVPTKGQGASD